MKMLKIKLPTLLLFATSFLLFSCEKELEPVSNDSSLTAENSEMSSFDEDAFFVYEEDVLMEPEILGAEEEEFYLESGAPVFEEEGDIDNCFGDHKRKPEDKKDGRHSDRKRTDAHHLGKILSQLDLNDTQKVQMRRLFTGYHKCVHANMKSLREENRKVMHRANMMRKKLIEAYKNGRISERELKQKLFELKRKVHQELKSNHTRKNSIDAIRNCRKTLYHKIASILSPEQLKKFKHLMEKK